jgi:hypothetical protein
MARGLPRSDIGEKHSLLTPIALLVFAHRAGIVDNAARPAIPEFSCPLK